MFERCLQGRSHHYNKCCNNEKHIKKNRKPSKHIVPICAHCTSMWLCVYGACGWILSGKHSMQKDQVVSWCSAVQNHYSNQPVLKGIEEPNMQPFLFAFQQDLESIVWLCLAKWCLLHQFYLQFLFIVIFLSFTVNWDIKEQHNWEGEMEITHVYWALPLGCNINTHVTCLDGYHSG